MSRGDTQRESGAVDLDRILAELEAEIDRRSLRAVARAVGMSPSGLVKVLAGSRPYRQTLNKLRSWQQRHLAGESLTEENQALETLLQRVPEHRRARARQQIRRILEGGGAWALRDP